MTRLTSFHVSNWVFDFFTHVVIAVNSCVAEAILGCQIVLWVNLSEPVYSPKRKDSLQMPSFSPNEGLERKLRFPL